MHKITYGKLSAISSDDNLTPVKDTKKRKAKKIVKVNEKKNIFDKYQRYFMTNPIDQLLEIYLLLLLLIEPAVLGLSPFDSKTCNEKCMWILVV